MRQATGKQRCYSPGKFSLRQPFPGYGDEAWKVCTQATVLALSLAPLLHSQVTGRPWLLSWASPQLLSLHDLNSQWFYVSCFLLRSALLPLSYHRFCQATVPSGAPSSRWPVATPPALCGTTELLRAVWGLSSAHLVSSLIHPFRWQSHNTQPQHCGTTWQACSSLCWFESASLKRSQPFKSALNLKIPQQMKLIMCYVLESCRNLSFIPSKTWFTRIHCS